MLEASLRQQVREVSFGEDRLTRVGTYPLIPLIGAWNSNNIGGSLKRGVGIAIQVGFGNFAGVVSAFAFLPHDAPR
jgi:hypothetical protein